MYANIYDSIVEEHSFCIWKIKEEISQISFEYLGTPLS